MSLTPDGILSLANDYGRALPPAPPPLPLPAGAELAAWIDHTLLKPEATADQIRRLCAEARHWRFASVCVNPVHVPLAAELLAGCATVVCSVVAFPLGASLPELKAHETRTLVAQGAAEIDMVVNIGALKSGDIDLALADVQAVVAAAGGASVKVILETALLTEHEKIAGCLVVQAAGAAFVKTSTGFGPGGATVKDVQLLRRVVGAGMGVKASGGIRSLEDARAMIAAGANRLGCSAGVSILEQATQGERHENNA